jgi:CheY-like chemotaxis protein
MATPPVKALVASGNKPWRSAFVEALYDEGCDLHAAATGFEALALIRKQPYDLIIIDDSFADVGALELCLNLRDLVNEMPLVMVSGEDLAKHVPFWRRFGLFFVGRRTAVLRNVANATERARRRLLAARPAQ